MSEAQTRFGPYRLLEELGRGGMGTVWLAVRDESPTPCVLKRLHVQPEEAGDIPIRFRREAHVAAQLGHDGIARLVDAGEIDDQFYIAFEYVPGVGLREVARVLSKRKEWMPPSLVVGVLLEVLESLAFAHAAKDPEGRPLDIVHRDLSPNNVMIGFDGRPRIIDFGIASAKVDDFKTEPGRVLGTVRYMSPEQARLGPADARSDLYTLSVVLYEMLSARRVVRKGTLQQMLADVVLAETVPLSEVAPELPAALAAVVMRGMEKDPEDRYQSAPELAAALRSAVADWELPDHVWVSNWLRHHLPKEAATNDARADRVQAALGLSSPAGAPSVATVTVARSDLEHRTVVRPPSGIDWSADELVVESVPSEDETPTRSIPIALEGPSTEGPTNLVKVSRPRRAPWGRALSLVVLAVALGLIGALVVRSPVAEAPLAPEAPTPRVDVRPAPQVVAQPQVAPKSAPPPSAPAKAAPARPRVKKPPAVRPTPPKPPPPSEDVGQARLRSLGQRIARVDPADTSAIVQLHAALRTEVERQAPGQRVRIMTEADRALRGGGVAALKSALGLLRAAVAH